MAFILLFHVHLLDWAAVTVTYEACGQIYKDLGYIGHLLRPDRWHLNHKMLRRGTCRHFIKILRDFFTTPSRTDYQPNADPSNGKIIAIAKEKSMN